MRILIIAMPESIHTARWISQISDQGWDIHLFPSNDNGLIHSSLRNVKVYHSFYEKTSKDKSVKIHGIPVYNKHLASLGKKILKKMFPVYRELQLYRLIKRIKPDIVHSIEIQAAGYLTLTVKKKYSVKYPSWIVTNWGSDIYLFGRLKEHESRIKEVLANCSFYSCECQRDVLLAYKFGFKGKTLPVFPNTGGFDLNAVSKLRQQGLTSSRRIIMLKGYQHWAGRALVGLRALERCADLLSEYEIMVYSASTDVIIAAELFEKSTGVKVTIIPPGTTHDEILSFHGKARMSIGLSISDAISTSLLEAMVMGSFPIQSWTACACEWIEDGKTGILVPPEDPDVIELALRRALVDDDLVNQAAEVNYQTAREKLDYKVLKAKTIDFYNTVLEEGTKKQWVKKF
jgi:glycosyltransferase involved in cell wall biosynthesis